MNSNKKTRCTDAGVEKSEMDSEKKARRSSILKPQKPRNPFSTLDFTEPNPDNTFARASRRVSFASSNFVKPFAADPEKNTIWDNTYEEEVNHTDSTKSSHEQTEEAKSTDFLNLTSIHSPTSDDEFFNNLSPQIIYPEGASKSINFNKNEENCNINHINVDHSANAIDSLISFVRSSNKKSALEACSINKTIYTEESVKITHSVGVINPMSNQFIHNTPLITPVNDTMDLTLVNNYSHMKNTEEMKICVNKENVNPIINDISLVAPVVENKLRRSSRLRGMSFDVHNQEKMLNENVNPEKAELLNCAGQTTILNQCDMELTECLSGMEIENQMEKTIIKTAYFLDNMELTKPLEENEKTRLHDEKPKYNKRDTIKFNRSDSDMEFTCTLPVSVENKRYVDGTKNENFSLLERCKSEMELTEALSTTCDVIPKRSSKDKFDSQRKTIHFNESENGMEFTNILPVTNMKETPLPAVNNLINLNPNNVKYLPILANKENIVGENNIYTKQKTSCFSCTEDNMELSGISEYKPDANSEMKLRPVDQYMIDTGHDRNSKRGTIHFDQSKGDMEFTAILPAIANNIDTHVRAEEMECKTSLFNDNVGIDLNPKRRTIHFDQSEGDMEFTTTLPIIANKININTHVPKEDMEFDTSLCADKVIKVIDAAVPNRKTINFNQSEADMEFTAVLPIADILKVKETCNDEIAQNSKKGTINFDQSEGDMEFTATLPVIASKNINAHGQAKEMVFNTSLFNQNVTKVSDAPVAKRKTIHFNPSEGDMEFTAVLPTSAILTVKEKCDIDSDKASIYLDKSEDNVKFTNTSIKETNEVSKMEHIEQEDVMIATPCRDKISITKKSTNPKRATVLCTQSNDDVEFTTTLSAKNEQIYEKDSHLTQEITKFSTNLLMRNEIFKKQVEKKSPEINVSTKMDITKIEPDLNVAENQVTSENIDALSKIQLNKFMVSKPPIINNNNDNKRHSNSENDDDVIKKIKIDHLSLNERVTNKSSDKNSDLRKTYLVSKQTGKYSEDNTPSNVAMENNINSDNSEKTFLVSKQTGKYAEDNIPSNVVMEIDIKSDNRKTFLVCKEIKKSPDDTLPIVEKSIHIKTDANQILSDIKVEQKVSLPPSTVTSGNILYAEPKKIHLKTHNFTPFADLSANSNLQTLEGSLNLNLVPVSTPATSFHCMNITNMSPCIEDTQQLIHATFSRPESLKKLLLGKETELPQAYSNDILYDKAESITSDVGDIEKQIHKTVDESYKGNEKTFTSEKPMHKTVDEKTFTSEQPIRKTVGECYKGNEKTFTVEKPMHKTVDESYNGNETNFTAEQCRGIEYSYVVKKPMKDGSLMLEGSTKKRDPFDCVEITIEHSPSSPDNLRTERSCYIEDISLLALAPADLDELSLVSNTSISVLPEHKTNKQDESLNNTSNFSTNDCHNYTLRCQSVLANIEKHLKSYKVEKVDYSKVTRQLKQLKDDDLVIKDLLKDVRIPNIMPIIDFEERHKQDLKDDSSGICETVVNIEDDKKAPSMAGLVARKSLHDRISETAERCKNQWKFVKMEDDYYYFLTLFETLPFKIHVHPELGIVYSIETYSKLAAVAKPICRYELELFQQRLKLESLLSVLGAKFDILTLLDYVCMTMEEVVNYHEEYNNLVKKYGKSHHFRMESDFSVVFEILNIDLIICWKISIKMSPTCSVSKDDVTATSKVGEKVNEEDIKCIAENTPKGSNFIRNFIENVNEYVQRIGKKIKFRRRDKF